MKQEIIEYGYADSKWGYAYGEISQKGIRRLILISEKGAQHPLNGIRNDEAIEKLTQAMICRDFTPKDLQFDLTGTDFQQKVWRELLNIPLGKTASYSEIAARIGTKAVRAVGTAIKNNPIFYIIPCHRIIRSNGEVGNYFYGTQIKQDILKYEQSLIK
ncbi:MAG: MGMT family protein [Bacteroidales bacterium]|jgi:AraC family transcriptional regulator of adaptative response/methylated-DNA-[protein]-cysteine methyltransferase|nr:MGMT family protein [Bacteroidales bacterium]